MSDFPDRQSLIQKHLDGQSIDHEAGALSKEIETNAKVRSSRLNPRPEAPIIGSHLDETRR